MQCVAVCVAVSGSEMQCVAVCVAVYFNASTHCLSLMHQHTVSLLALEPVLQHVVSLSVQCHAVQCRVLQCGSAMQSVTVWQCLWMHQHTPTHYLSVSTHSNTLQLCTNTLQHTISLHQHTPTHYLSAPTHYLSVPTHSSSICLAVSLNAPTYYLSVPTNPNTLSLSSICLAVFAMCYKVFRV